jgi:signal peptidase I
MRKLIRALLWTIALLGVLIAALRFVALRWWKIPEDDLLLAASIAPTLRAGDLVVLWRLTAPTYGDLVVCPEPDAPERIAVGRIVGEAGDRLKLEGQNVWVNDERASTERPCAAFVVSDPQTGQEIEQRCDVEVLGSGSHLRGAAAGRVQGSRATTHEVGPRRIFLVSDNRLYPYDSRDYGPVTRSDCKERVVFRLLSARGFSDVDGRFTFIR